MKREKSCGAVVYCQKDDGLHFLLIRHRRGGHWSFPKGHVEDGESEEQTALREIREETGLVVTLCKDFRHSVEYSPKPNVKKQVVYFLGRAEDERLVRQEEEISDLKWMKSQEAQSAVTFKNDRMLLSLAREYLGRDE